MSLWRREDRRENEEDLLTGTIQWSRRLAEIPHPTRPITWRMSYLERRVSDLCTELERLRRAHLRDDEDETELGL